MNDPTPSKLTTQEKCYQHLIGLKYAMAGDLESAEAIETLLARCKVIEWDNPAFVQFSREMRTGIDDLSPEQETLLMPSIAAMIYAFAEEKVQRDEALALLSGNLRKLAEHQKEAFKRSDALADFSSKMIELCRQMKDRLEVLGDDVLAFEFPKL